MNAWQLLHGAYVMRASDCRISLSHVDSLQMPPMHLVATGFVGHWLSAVQANSQLPLTQVAGAAHWLSMVQAPPLPGGVQEMTAIADGVDRSMGGGRASWQTMSS